MGGGDAKARLMVGSAVASADPSTKRGTPIVRVTTEIFINGSAAS
jgi:hypothetical protein